MKIFKENGNNENESYQPSPKKDILDSIKMTIKNAGEHINAGYNNVKQSIVTKIEEIQEKNQLLDAFIHEANCYKFIYEFPNEKRKEIYAYKDIDSANLYFFIDDEKRLSCNLALYGNNQEYIIVDISRESVLLKDKYPCIKAKYEIKKTVSQINNTNVINNNFQNASVVGNINIYNSNDIQRHLKDLQTEIGKIRNPFKRKECEQMFVTFGNYVERGEKNESFFNKFISFLSPISQIAANIVATISALI